MNLGLSPCFRTSRRRPLSDMTVKKSSNCWSRKRDVAVASSSSRLNRLSDRTGILSASQDPRHYAIVEPACLANQRIDIPAGNQKPLGTTSVPTASHFFDSYASVGVTSFERRPVA